MEEAKTTIDHLFSRVLSGMFFLGLILLLAFPAVLRAQQHEDFDQYKLQITGSWFYSNPSGTLQGQSDTVPVDFQKDLGFNSYSTFSTKVDWKFTRKNHFYIALSRFNDSHQHALQRTIVFQGNTFTVGLVAQSSLRSFLAAPGYQYDIIRRKRGHLGIGVQIDLFDSSASIQAAAQIVNGVQHAAVFASGSLLAPIPVAGPQFRLYLTNSPRLFVEGAFYGMYFFGYGNFVSTSDRIGYSLNKHFYLTAGYELGSRLIVNSNSTNRIGLRMTQKGPTVGLGFSF
jgi:hypothetical protein